MYLGAGENWTFSVARTIRIYSVRTLTNSPLLYPVYMKGLSLVRKVKSHSKGRRRSVEVGTRLGAGVEAEGVVAELVSKLRSLVDRRHSRRG